MTELADLAALARQTWRERARCSGSGREFVDPDPAEVDDLIRTYCHHCPVVGACREQGDAEAPHPWPVIYGARHYTKGEPVDGWCVA